MSAYELDDGLVRAFVAEAWPVALASKLAGALERQIPIPVPTKIGAVVVTDSALCAPELSVFVRWASPIQTDKPWMLREELDRTVYSTAKIGRITEVLSEGVDL